MFKIFKKKRPQNVEVIDIGKIKEIHERHNIKTNFEPPQQEVAYGPAADNVPESGGALGFLGALAGANTGNSTEQESATESIYDPEESDKLSRLNRRLYKVMERLELVERKLERLEDKDKY